MATVISPPVPVCLQLLTNPDGNPSTSAAYDQIIPSGNMMGYRYTVDLILLGPQGYYNNTLVYTTNDMKAGGWISGTIGGFAWKITEIFSSDGTNITLQLEDEENYNYNIDGYGNGGAPLFAQPFIYFELSPEGLPIFTPLYSLYLDTLLTQLPSDTISRFLARNRSGQYVPAFQPIHGFNGGETIWIDPTDGKYKLANNPNAQYVVGIVTSVNIPIPGWFTYKAYGFFYNNITKHFTNVDLSSYPKGTFLYIATDGIQQYTDIQPADIAVPAWVYLGTDSYGNQQGILYTVPSLYNGSTGSVGPTGARGASGNLFYSTTIGNWVSNPVVVGGSETLTISPGLSYIPGNSVIVVARSDPTIFFQGRMLSYDKVNGNTEIYVTSISGGPSFPSDVYQVNINPLDGAAGAQGASGDLFYSITTSSWIFGTLVPGQPTTLQIAPGLSFTPGNSVVVTANSDCNQFFQGRVVSYDDQLGNITINVLTIGGSPVFPNDFYLVNLNPIDGTQGDTGSIGIQGSTGPRGDTGFTGPSGPQGDTGMTGAEGRTGPPGFTGATGPSGDLFMSITPSFWASDPVEVGGIETIVFAPGLSFVPGNSAIVVSATDPCHFFQARVEFYDAQTGSFRFRIMSIHGDNNFCQGHYVLNINPLDGPQGAVGPQGPEGPVGPQGIDGSAVNTGATGPPGPQGSIGPQGEVGSSANTGATGLNGATGATGLQGSTGPPGLASNTGATGASGAAGVGVPTGGTEGQFLVKTTSANYDANWITPVFLKTSIIRFLAASGSSLVINSRDSTGNPSMFTGVSNTSTTVTLSVAAPYYTYNSSPGRTVPVLYFGQIIWNSGGTFRVTSIPGINSSGAAPFVTITGNNIIINVSPVVSLANTADTTSLLYNTDSSIGYALAIYISFFI